MKSLFVHQRKNIRVAWRASATILIMRNLRVVKAVMRNVSVHGALLFCDEPLEVGTKAR